MARPKLVEWRVAALVAALEWSGLTSGVAGAQTAYAPLGSRLDEGAAQAAAALRAQAQSGGGAVRRPPSSVRAGALVSDQAVREALRNQPLLRGYAIEAKSRGRQVVLTGRVGSSLLHDAALQAAMATGASIRDDLVIDTAAAHEVMAAAAAANMPSAVNGVAPRSTASPSLGEMPRTLYASASVPYVYPPPLFGRLDDPFFGFEPPMVSYPPWWGYVANREPINLDVVARAGMLLPPYGLPTALMNGPQPQAVPATGAQPNPPAKPFKREFPRDPNTPPPPPTPDDPRLRPGPTGQAPATSRVAPVPAPPGPAPSAPAVNPPSEGAPSAPVGTPVNPSRTEPQIPPPPSISPAKPHETVALAPGFAGKPVVLSDRGGSLADRLERVFADRPVLANLPLKVVDRGGEVTISGKVPSVYEAMLAYRAVEQTPGVRTIHDKLEFAVPDDDHKNPLLAKGRPSDVESYAAAQIRRQFGDQAHVDRVRLSGGALEVEGTLARAEDAARIEAILRSMPVLRGFKLEPQFHAD